MTSHYMELIRWCLTSYCPSFASFYKMDLSTIFYLHWMEEICNFICLDIIRKIGQNFPSKLSNIYLFLNIWNYLNLINWVLIQGLLSSIYYKYFPKIFCMYRVSQKKLGLVFRGHFRPLNDRKSKKARKQTPPKMQFYLLGGAFKSVCRL